MQMFAEGPKHSSLARVNRLSAHLQMKKKRKRREEKESRKWGKVLSLTGRPGLHIHDFQFNSEEVEGINWRGEIESVHVGKIHYEPTSQQHSRLLMPYRM